MIGKVRGILSEVHANFGLIQTAGGISYEVHLPPALLSRTLGSDLDVYTHLQVRDDAHVLFGFEQYRQLTLFRMLIAVSGVGPKSAFSIIAFSSASEIVDAIGSSDVAFFQRVKGLGKKSAQKIILELSSKLDSEVELDQLAVSDDDKTVVDALVALGYKAQEARSMLSAIPDGLSVEDSIRHALSKPVK